MEFKAFNKIPRLSREVIITEKIDGTNGIVGIWMRNELSQEELDNPKFPYMSVTKDGLDYVIIAGSRTKWIDIHNDNAGFGRWVSDNREELIKLGVGYHYGEWWGQKIQRGYDLKEKRFSLFNTSIWTSEWNKSWENKGDNLCLEIPICDVVPILGRGEFDTELVNTCLNALIDNGSFANPGFMKPEGIVIYHVPSGFMFKKTIEKDEAPKGQNGV